MQEKGAMKSTETEIEGEQRCGIDSPPPNRNLIIHCQAKEKKDGLEKEEMCERNKDRHIRVLGSLRKRCIPLL